MSDVHLIMIKNRRIYFITKHYRKIRQILENTDKISSNGKYIDAGYILVDFDKNEMINCQDAFALELV